MTRADSWATIRRAHPLVWIALAVCTGVSVLFTALAFLTPSTYGLEYETLINVNLFSCQVAPLYLLLLCFGSVQYTMLERVRSDPSHAFTANLLWLSLCAVIATVPVLISYIVTVFLVERRPVDHAVTQTTMAMGQLLMELIVVGLITNIAVHCGLAWGYVTPAAIVIIGLSGWLFSTWNKWVGEMLYFFLEPMPDAESLIYGKILPFIGVFVLVTALNLVLCRHVDYRGA